MMGGGFRMIDQYGALLRTYYLFKSFGFHQLGFSRTGHSGRWAMNSGTTSFSPQHGI
jgi:hypothetical protein